MTKFFRPIGIVLAAALAAACGSSSQTSEPSVSFAPGTLALDPPFRVASANPALLAAQIGATTSGAQLLQIAGAPTCGVDFYYLKFWTLGGAGEPTQSSGALMVPTGGAGCSGPRPIVLYAHGFQTDQAYNIADISDPTNTEGAIIAATFAAQGYIVVAPNYAGYDISTLGYHPALNATQQSGEMMDILTAARMALPNTYSSATSDNGQLFVTGFSEGGFVAMATQRALQAAGATVTAAAPVSGPYALEAFGDATFFGGVFLDSTIFAPFITTSYQQTYKNIYVATTDVYSSTYATGIDTLLPSTTPITTLFADGRLPELALFNSSTPTTYGGQPLPPALVAALAVPAVNPAAPETALFASGFGSPYLINNDYRVSYVLDALADPDGGAPTPVAGAPLAAVPPTQTLRLALYTNDMRNGNWAPTSPTLLCGGDQDPTVLFSVNTLNMADFWSTTPAAALITVLDVNAPPAGPFAAAQAGFQQAGAQQLAFYMSAAGGGLSLAAAEQLLIQSYHDAVLPFCASAARSFFSNI